MEVGNKNGGEKLIEMIVRRVKHGSSEASKNQVKFVGTRRVAVNVQERGTSRSIMARPAIKVHLRICLS